MTITSRLFCGSDDFWKVRHLLIESYPITPVGFNWEIRRWDGAHFYHKSRDIDPRWFKQVRLWETDGGRLVGAAHPEGSGDAFFELHPAYRFLEDEMLAWSEEHLAAQGSEGKRLLVFAFEYDVYRQQLLTQHGYEKMTWHGYTRRMRFGSPPLPTVNMADGYTMRTTRHSDDDNQRMADLLNAAFNRTFHNAQEYEIFSTMSPSFRHDLNLIAEAPDGTFAAHVGITYDPVNRRGIFEPVCTHPDHQRKGLARALMVEGLHRLKALAATDVYVDAGDSDASNPLYDAIGITAGFVESYKGFYWRKIFA